MRLGKIEKAILAYLGNLDESTNFESMREDIRKGIGYDPDVTALYNAKKMVGENPRLNLSRMVTTIKYSRWMKNIQASFSRALHRLIEKELIIRYWDVKIRTGVIGRSVSFLVIHDERIGEVRGFLTYPPREDEFDVPRCDVEIVCHFELTSRGRNEVRKRGMANPI